jgi:hypothetical protein
MPAGNPSGRFVVSLVELIEPKQVMIEFLPRLGGNEMERGDSQAQSAWLSPRFLLAA